MCEPTWLSGGGDTDVRPGASLARRPRYGAGIDSRPQHVGWWACPSPHVGEGSYPENAPATLDEAPCRIIIIGSLATSGSQAFLAGNPRTLASLGRSPNGWVIPSECRGQVRKGVSYD